MLRLFVTVLLLITHGIVQAEQLSDPVEKQISIIIRNNNQAALSLLEKAVNINSGTMNFAGVKKVGRVFQQELDELGFKTTWIDGTAFNRAGHLLAEHGNTGPKILLIGHLDTVFPSDSDFQEFELINESTAKGPGVTDDKGGIVVIIGALKALKMAGVLDRLSIRIFLAGDEEDRGEPLVKANRPLLDAARWADIAIGFEDGDSNPKTAVIARRSASSWTLKITAKTAHSSQIFREDIGYGAIFEAARILDEFRRKLSGEKYLTFNPGMIIGGTRTSHDPGSSSGTAFGKSNVIPQQVTVTGGIRAITPAQLENAKQGMQEIVKSNLNKTAATLEFDQGYPPLAPTPGNEKLLALYSQASLDLGQGPVIAVDPRRAGAADISFTAGYVDMALDGIGLMGSGGHTVNETADLHTLPRQTERAALLLYRLSKQ